MKNVPGTYYQDVDNRKSRLDVAGTANVETLSRYDMGMGFTITTSYCRSFSIGNDMADLFWPWLGVATAHGPTVLPNGIRCNEYTYTRGTTGLYACVLSADDATPVLLNVNSNDGQTSYFFVNFTSQRPSPAVFNVPPTCTSLAKSIN